MTMKYSTIFFLLISCLVHMGKTVLKFNTNTSMSTIKSMGCTLKFHGLVSGEW